MNFPGPDDDIVDHLFTEFLADQKARLSPQSYLQYVAVIELFDLYLARYYRPDCSRREYDAPARSDERFRGFPPAVDLVGRFSVFLDEFLPCEMAVGAERLRAARTVIKALGAWLTTKGYVVRNKAARKRANKSNRPPYLAGFFQD
jgi:acetyl esterase/lipase